MGTKTWMQALNDRKFVRTFAVALFFLIIMLWVTKVFLVYNDTRLGSVLNDPIINLFNPIDLTWPTFAMLVVAVVGGVIVILTKPQNAMEWAVAYSFLLAFRIITIYLIPLEPPPKMIFLNDPVVAAFTNTRTPVRDLFFSGHTSATFLIYLCVPKFKWLFLLLSIAIGIAVVAQHVHYSVDAIAAPFFAYFALKLSRKLTKFLGVATL